MNRLAQTLVAFLWQGALVAALLGAANLFLRKSAVRYAAACGALAALFLFPLATYLRPGPAAAGLPVLAPAGIEKQLQETASVISPLPAGIPTLPLFPAGTERTIVLVWLAGVLALSVRLAGGWAAVGTLRRDGVAEPEPAWAERAVRLGRRLGLARPVRLLASSRVAVPAAFGVIRPVVLLPAAAFSALPVPALEALLAHELAHIRRHDYLVNLAQSVAETLFFYHPAVWWISHRLRVERENACDDLAVLATGSITVYARALLDLEEIRPAAPLLTVAATGSPLSQRIARLLERGRSAGRGPRSLPALLGLLTAFGLLLATRAPRAGAVALPQASSPPPAAAPAEATAPTEPAPEAPAAAPRSASRPSRALAVAAPPAPAEKDAEPSDQEAPEAPAEPAPEAPRDPAKTALLTPERLIEFRIHGVTPEFVEEVRALGFSRVTADQLVAMRIHGVTPAFVREIHDLGYPAVSADQLIAMRIHGVTPDYIRAMNRRFGEKLPVSELVGARIHGVEGDNR